MPATFRPSLRTEESDIKSVSLSAEPLSRLSVRAYPFPCAELCPNANIALSDAIFIWFANQTLTTRGNPTDSTRATLTIANANITCALFTSIDNVNGISIQNIQVDGAKPSLGIVYGGLALIEIGGNTVSALSSWSCRLHR